MYVERMSATTATALEWSESVSRFTHLLAPISVSLSSSFLFSFSSPPNPTFCAPTSLDTHPNCATLYFTKTSAPQTAWLTSSATTAISSTLTASQSTRNPRCMSTSDARIIASISASTNASSRSRPGFLRRTAAWRCLPGTTWTTSLLKLMRGNSTRAKRDHSVGGSKSEKGVDRFCGGSGG